MRKLKNWLLTAGIAAVMATGVAVGAHLTTNDAPMRTEAAIEKIPTKVQKSELVSGNTYYVGLDRDGSLKNKDNIGTHYFTGKMSGFYLATNKSITKAIPLTYLDIGNGQFTLSSGGNYLGIKKSNDGQHINAIYDTTYDDSKKFTMNDQNLATISLDQTTYTLGTKGNGDFTTIGPVDVTLSSYFCYLFEERLPAPVFGIEGLTANEDGTYDYKFDAEAGPAKLTAIADNLTDTLYSWKIESGDSVTLGTSTEGISVDLNFVPGKENVTTTISCYILGNEGEKTLTIHVIPTVKTVSAIAINSTSHKTSFILKEPFNYENLTLNVSYTDAAYKDETISEGFTVSEVDTCILGNQKVTVSYKGQTVDYNINVTNKAGKSPDVVLDKAFFKNGYQSNYTNTKNGVILTSDGKVGNMESGKNSYIQVQSKCVLTITGNIDNLEKVIVDVFGGTGTFNGTDLTKNKNEITSGLTSITIKSTSTLQLNSITLIYKETATTATAAEQANAYADYLYTFRTCAADFADRKAIVTLVNEYNYMTQDAKNAFGSLAARADEAGGNISCTPLEKLKLTVDQYNSTLVKGETKLVLHISDTENYSGMNDVSMINFENSTAIIIIVSISVLAISGIAIFAITRRKKLAK